MNDTPPNFISAEAKLGVGPVAFVGDNYPMDKVFDQKTVLLTEEELWNVLEIEEKFRSTRRFIAERALSAYGMNINDISTNNLDDLRKKVAEILRNARDRKNNED